METRRGGVKMTKSNRDFTEDRAICAAATDGPWYTGIIGTPQISAWWQVLGGERLRVVSADIKMQADARFIAEARTGWPAALDEIERLKAEKRFTYYDAFRAGMIEYAFELMCGKTTKELGERIARMDLRREEVTAIVSADPEDNTKKGGF